MHSNNPSGGSSQDQIAARAYQLWERDGGTHGRDRDHWHQAEQEIAKSGDAQEKAETQARPAQVTSADRKAVKRLPAAMPGLSGPPEGPGS